MLDQPCPRFAKSAHGLSQDRFLVEEPPQFLRQGAGAGVAQLRFLLQTLEADRFQVRGNFAVELRRRNRRLLDHGAKCVERARAAERWFAREHLVEHRPQ